MPFPRTLSLAVLSSLVLWTGSAGATLTYVVDSAASSLGVVNAEFNKIPPTFQTTLEPVAPDDWVRLLGGTFTADETTGALETADIQIFGDPLAGDQILLDNRGNPEDGSLMWASQFLEELRGRKDPKSCGFVCPACRSVARITPRLDHRGGHSGFFEPVERMIGQVGRDAPSLKIRINRDHVDLADPILGKESQSDKSGDS